MEQPIHLLLVEDDDVEAEALQRAFRAWPLPHTLTIARDGLEALAVLRGNAHTPPLLRPHLILLDLNLPRMNGLELLGVLRQDPKLRNSIVFVWTTSTNQADVQAAYEQAVAGYLVKSRVGASPKRLLDLLQSYCQMIVFPIESSP